MPDSIDIGEVCAMTGLLPSALHFYERKGLIASEDRSGLRRRYSPATLERLKVILLARRAGIGLGEIAAMLEGEGSAAPNLHFEAALAEVKARIQALATLQEGLEHALAGPDKSLLRCGHQPERAEEETRPDHAGICLPRIGSTTRPPAAKSLDDLAWLRRVRDRIDREYARPLDVEALARGANMSAGHLSRQFRLAYGESPYSYLMTRRVERAMRLLERGDLSVTEVCFAVGYSSLGTFSARFSELVGSTPSAYKRSAAKGLRGVPACVTKQVARPVRNREAADGGL